MDRRFGAGRKRLAKWKLRAQAAVTRSALA
jgi:hypothetical protein